MSIFVLKDGVQKGVCVYAAILCSVTVDFLIPQARLAFKHVAHLNLHQRRGS